MSRLVRLQDRFNGPWPSLAPGPAYDGAVGIALTVITTMLVLVNLSPHLGRFSFLAVPVAMAAGAKVFEGVQRHLRLADIRIADGYSFDK